MTANRSIVCAAALALGCLAVPALAVDLGPELHVNLGEDHFEAHPVAFFDAGGGVTVVWENMQLGLRARRFTRQGHPLSDNLALVNNVRLPMIPGVGPIVYRSQPAVVPHPEGGFLLFWTEEQATYYVQYFHEWRDVHDRDIVGQRFDAAGRPLGRAFRVNRRRAGFQTRPAAALGRGGRVLVSWQTEAGGGGGPAGAGVFARLFDLEGNALGDDVRLSGPGGERPAVAASRDGYLAAWEAPDGDSDGAFAALLDRRGQPRGDAFQVNTSTPGPQRRPAVAAATDGGYLVLWQGRFEEPRRARIYGQAVGADGTFLGPELQISDGEGTVQTGASVVATPGGFLVAWIDYFENFPLGIFGVELDALGNPIGGELAISGDPVNAQYRTGIATDGRGNVLVTWEGFHGEERGISGRRLTERSARSLAFSE